MKLKLTDAPALMGLAQHFAKPKRFWFIGPSMRLLPTDGPVPAGTNGKSSIL